MKCINSQPACNLRELQSFSWRTMLYRSSNFAKSAVSSIERAEQTVYPSVDRQSCVNSYCSHTRMTEELGCLHLIGTGLSCLDAKSLVAVRLECKLSHSVSRAS